MKTILIAISIFIFCAVAFLATVDLEPYLAEKVQTKDETTVISVNEQNDAEKKILKIESASFKASLPAEYNQKTQVPEHHTAINNALQEAEHIALANLQPQEPAGKSETPVEKKNQLAALPQPITDRVQTSAEKKDEQDIILSDSSGATPNLTVESGILKKNPPSFMTLKKTDYPYSLLLETFNELDMARQAIPVFQHKGIDAHWVKVDLGSKGIKYRLFSGVFPTEDAATAFAANHGLSDKPVKLTRYASLIGTYDKLEDARKDFEKVNNAEVVPYILATDDTNFFLYAGAFYTMAGAQAQCAELKQKDLECTPVVRSTHSF